MNFKLKRIYINFFRSHFFLIIFLLVYFSLIIYKLVSSPPPFYDWDEAIYAQVGREMILNKSLVPLWQGKIWLDKPPLPMVVYGIIGYFTPFIRPEISYRLFNIGINLIILLFVYRLTLIAVNQVAAKINKTIGFITVVITAFTPLFLQRVHQINVDNFLFLGWLGYLLFFNHFGLSLVFLAIAVLSKSLIGFYPAVVFFIYHLYRLLIKKINSQQFLTIGKKILAQIIILSSWYLIMLIVFKQDFWQQHFIESHLRRVTASIEFHFGKRTFYLEMIDQQFSWLGWIAIIGFIYSLYLYLKKQITDYQLLIINFFIPWFIFLNLTKTKIFWYFYPVLAQIALLISLPLCFSKKKKNFLLLVVSLLTLYTVNRAIFKEQFLTSRYSKIENYYILAGEARNYCRRLDYVIPPTTRNDYATLETMGLLITTSKWWGDHPSVVYYFGKPVNFIYNIDRSQFRADCLVIDQSDINLINDNYQLIKRFGDLLLFRLKPKLYTTIKYNQL